MAGDVVLDTSVVIAHFRSDKEIARRLETTDTLWVPSIVMGELFYGAYRASNPDIALNNVRQFLEITTVLLVDEDAAERYGQIKKTLAEGGTPIPDNDIWIAASAMQHDLHLAARDEHFARIAGLKVEMW